MKMVVYKYHGIQYDSRESPEGIGAKPMLDTGVEEETDLKGTRVRKPIQRRSRNKAIESLRVSAGAL